jgi:hypothetical protein
MVRFTAAAGLLLLGVGAAVLRVLNWTAVRLKQLTEQLYEAILDEALRLEWMKEQKKN